MAPKKKRQPSSRATPAAKRGKKGADERRFSPEDDARILAWAAEHTIGKRISWDACAAALFCGRDPPVTDEHVRERHYRIKRNERHAADAPARAAEAAARRLEARECEAARDLRRVDGQRRFADLTAPEAMAQLHVCGFCERALFRHEMHRSPHPAFDAAADEESGDAPATYTVEQVHEYLDADPSPATVAEALGEPAPEAEEEEEEELELELEEEEDPHGSSARRRGSRGPRPRRASRRAGPVKARRLDACVAGRGIQQPQARTRRARPRPWRRPWPTCSTPSARMPRGSSTW